MVEDNELVRRSVRRMLVTLGYEVEAAESAQDALVLLETGLIIDILFTDIRLSGGIDGIALAAEVQRRRPGLPVLLTSGDGESLDPGTPGARLPIIFKPYTRAELGSRLGELVTPAA